MKRSRRPHAAKIDLPRHWTPEQALAVFEALCAVREALWRLYGTQAQQAWLDQLEPPGCAMPGFDPDEPF